MIVMQFVFNVAVSLASSKELASLFLQMGFNSQCIIRET